MYLFISWQFFFLFIISFVDCREPSTAINCTNWEETISVYGVRVFMLGDRSFVIPRNLTEIDTVTCPRLLGASDSLKSVVRSCLQPFPKTIAGLAIRGSRKTIKAKCNDMAEKQFIIKHLSCLRPSNRIDQLHDIIDLYNRKLVYIRDSIPVNKKLDLLCCHYFVGRKAIIDTSRRFCPQAAVDYAVSIVDDMFKEALDIACAGYQQNESKCNGTELPVTMTSKKETDAFLLPLIQVLTAIGDE